MGVDAGPGRSVVSGVPKWLAYSLLAGLCWGLWGILSKLLEAAHLTTYQIQILFTLGLIPPAALAGMSKGFRTGKNDTRGFAWGVAAGFLGGLGNIAFYEALGRGGKASVVVPLTSLYPLVTLAVAWPLLAERLNRIQMAGVAVSIAAVVLLSGEAAKLTDPVGWAADVSASGWMVASFVALTFWGLLSVAQKISTNHASPELTFVGFCVAFVPMAGVIFAVEPVSRAVSPTYILLGVAAGTMNGLGVLASFAAYRAEGKAAVVTPLAGVAQSAFTVALAVTLLGETLGPVEVVGCLTAVIASAALSFEKPPDPVEGA
jgi:drug/metabolite transporter (DMT)-like permease